MSADVPEPLRRRRYGEELVSALLEAAWAELVDVGYGGLTMASVAARAHTSEPVLYRRWSNKKQLVMAALEHYGNVHPVAVPDTGSLRDDLIAHLTSVSETFSGYYAIAAAAAFSGLLADTGLTPAEARATIMEARHEPPVRTVYQNAHQRGEIDLQRIPSAVLAMPFDLVRHDMLLNLRPLAADRILSIVDELFLPLLHQHDGAVRG